MSKFHLLLVALVCVAVCCAIGRSVALQAATTNATDDSNAFVTDGRPPHPTTGSNNQEAKWLLLLRDKCSQTGRGRQTTSKRCQKLREREKQAAAARGRQQAASLNDIWSDADLLQHPIDEEPRRPDRALGELCLYSADCRSGCCLLDRESRIRSCQPKSARGERCTSAQLKADLYVDVCPCASGASNCVYPGEYCSK